MLQQIKCSSNPGSRLTSALQQIKTKKTSKRGTEDKSTEKAEDSRKTPRLRQVNLTSRLQREKQKTKNNNNNKETKVSRCKVNFPAREWTQRECKKKPGTWKNSKIQQIKRSKNSGNRLTSALQRIKTKKPSKSATENKNAEKAEQLWKISRLQQVNLTSTLRGQLQRYRRLEGMGGGQRLIEQRFL